MKHLSLLFLLAAAVFATELKGQGEDAGSWIGLEINRDLKKGFDLSLESNLRIDQNFGRLHDAILDFSGKKKWTDWWKSSLTYRFGSRFEGGEASYRGRWALDQRFEHDFGKIIAEYRFRYQINQLGNLEEMGWRSNEQAIRHKLDLTWDLPDKWELGTSYERFTEAYTDGQAYSTDWRWKLVAQKGLSKRKSLSFGIQVQRNLTQSALPTEYIFLFGYSLDLKKRKKRPEEE